MPISQSKETKVWICEECGAQHNNSDAAYQCEDQDRLRDKQNNCKHENFIYEPDLNSGYDNCPEFEIDKRCKDCYKLLATKEIRVEGVSQDELKRLFGD